MADGDGLRTLAVFHVPAVSGPQRSLTPVLRLLNSRGTVESVVPSGESPTPPFDGLGPVKPASYSPLTYPHGLRDVFRNLWRLALDTRAVRRELRASEPDLVLVVTASLPAALAAARIEGLPTVLYAAEIYENDWRRRPLFRLWSKLLIRVTAWLADGIVCCSHTVARQFSQTRGKPVSVAYPPIGAEYADGSRTRGRERWRFASDDLCVVVVGNLSAGRGQDVAIRALPLVREQHPTARLLLVGAPHSNTADRKYAASLRELAAKLDVADDVVFAGEVDDIADVYAAAELVLNPARTAESFGRAAAEALLAGVPVVASNVGALPEVLREEVDAMLVPPDDPARLAEAAVRVLQDSELARRLVASGRERVRTAFNSEQDLAVWTDVLEAILPGSLVANPPARGDGDAGEPRRRRAIARDP